MDHISSAFVFETAKEKNEEVKSDAGELIGCKSFSVVSKSRLKVVM